MLWKFLMLRPGKLLALLLFLSSFATAQPCGHVLDFSGIGSYVACGPGAFYNDKGSLTVEAWVNLSSTMIQQTIVGTMDSINRSGFSMGVQNGHFSCQIIDSSGTLQGFTAGRVPANTWTHLAFTYQQGGRFRGYINGVQIVNFPSTAYPIGNSGTSDLVIGAAAWDRNRYPVIGRVDEVRIFNYQRSTAQLRDDMRIRFLGSTPGLIGYWRFDEGIGTITQDYSLSNHPGLLSGTILPGWIIADGPYGAGTASLRAIGSFISFTDEGIELIPNSSGINDTFVVTRIHCAPNVLPTGTISYTYDYWVVDRYDTSAGLLIDIVFKLDSGAIDTLDAISPGNFILYHRDRFSVGPWTPVSVAVSASTANATLRFNSIVSNGQFIIGTTGTSLLGSDRVDIDPIVYPQPADRYLFYESIAEFRSGQFTFIDLQGRILLAGDFASAKGVIDFDVSGLPDGSYLLRLQDKKHSVVVPVIVYHR